MRLIEKLLHRAKGEVQCALCLGTIKKGAATPLFGRHACNWCVNYYSIKFPNGWKEKARLNMLL